jgi:hypothetical protein
MKLNSPSKAGEIAIYKRLVIYGVNVEFEKKNPPGGGFRKTTEKLAKLTGDLDQNPRQCGGGELTVAADI